MKEKVELHQAFMWDCPNCGVEHFERAIRPEMAPEQFEELREDFGLEEGQDGDFLMMPTEVTCDVCGCSFEVTEEVNEDDDDFDPGEDVGPAETGI